MLRADALHVQHVRQLLEPSVQRLGVLHDVSGGGGRAAGGRVVPAGAGRDAPRRGQGRRRRAAGVRSVREGPFGSGLGADLLHVVDDWEINLEQLQKLLLAGGQRLRPRAAQGAEPRPGVAPPLGHVAVQIPTVGEMHSGRGAVAKGAAATDAGAEPARGASGPGM